MVELINGLAGFARLIVLAIIVLLPGSCLFILVFLFMKFLRDKRRGGR